MTAAVWSFRSWRRNAANNQADQTGNESACHPHTPREPVLELAEKAMGVPAGRPPAEEALPSIGQGFPLGLWIYLLVLKASC